jgi:peptide/nickel transport system ATP-binding protein
VRNVTAGYGSIDVLKDISFDIHARRTVAVVGESGSGKSTTARVITGLLPPRRGEVLFNGEPCPRLPPPHRDQLRQAQMIYQMADTALNPKLKLRDHRSAGADVSRAQRQGAGGPDQGPPVADRAGAGRLHRPLPSELSGGQKQRIGIARALAAEPQFIICDEVTSALDQLVAEGILKLLDRLQGEFEPRLHVHHPRSRHGARHRRRGGGDEGRQGGRTGARRRDVPSPRTTPTPTCCCPRCRRWTPTGWSTRPC